MVDIPQINKLKEELERRLKSSWSAILALIVKMWKALRKAGNLTQHSAKTAVRHALQQWPHTTTAENIDFLQQIFATSFAAGIVDTELAVTPDAGDEQAVEWLTNKRNGFLPALERMSLENQKTIEKIIEKSYEAEGNFDLDYMMREIRDATEVGKDRAELIVRTETAKISALGRIFAWGKDSDRDWFDYYWMATPDDRVKDISLKFEREGPYSYDMIKHIWEHDHNEPQLVRNRKTGRMEQQVSAYNCRCTVARRPKSTEQLVAEGKISFNRS